MAHSKKLLEQFRKPLGWRGRYILWKMNREHARLTDWGLAHAAPQKNSQILDIGCGGGRTISKLAVIATQGKVYGIDYSPESVAASRRTNARAVAQGRVEIQQGSVSQLPFSSNIFDLITAVETHFFWPDLPADVREVFRVLKPGGTFMIIAEVYKGAEKMTPEYLAKHAALRMNLLSIDEHRELFSQAGYTDIQIAEEREQGWICCTGKKPLS